MPSVPERDSKDEDSNSIRWWFKFVVVPLLGVIIGGSGILKLIDSSGSKPVEPGPTPGTTVAPSGDDNKIAIVGGSSNKVNIGDEIHLAPEEPAKAFKRTIWMTENETKVVQGLTISTNNIFKMGETGKLCVELSVSDDGMAVVPMTRTTSGKAYSIRKGPVNAAVVTVEEVVLELTDPNLTSEKIDELGIRKGDVLFKVAKLTVAGKSKSLDPFEELEKDKQRIAELQSSLNNSITLPSIGRVDSSLLQNEEKAMLLNLAVLDKDMRTVDIFLKQGVSPNSMANGERPLHHALYTRNLQMFRHLLAHGADPNKENAKGISVVEELKRKPNKEFSDAIESSKAEVK